MGRGETTYATIRMIDLLLRRPHIKVVTPENSNPSKPPRPWWSSDAEDRAIDMYFYWELAKAVEERSLDREIEMMRELIAERKEEKKRRTPGRRRRRKS
jgi:hypothetical protein